MMKLCRIFIISILLLGGSVDADVPPPCVDLSVWNDVVVRVLSLTERNLSGGISISAYDRDSRALMFTDEATGDEILVPLDETFELVVEREKARMNPAAQSAAWEVEEEGFEEVTLTIPLEKLHLEDQVLHAGSMEGCAPRPEDRASFEAGRLWVQNATLYAKGRMMRYERIYFGSSDESPARKGG